MITNMISLIDISNTVCVIAISAGLLGRAGNAMETKVQNDGEWTFAPPKLYVTEGPGFLRGEYVKTKKIPARLVKGVHSTAKAFYINKKTKDEGRNVIYYDNGNGHWLMFSEKYTYADTDTPYPIYGRKMHPMCFAGSFYFNDYFGEARSKKKGYMAWSFEIFGNVTHPQIKQFQRVKISRSKPALPAYKKRYGDDDFSRQEADDLPGVPEIQRQCSKFTVPESTTDSPVPSHETIVVKEGISTKKFRAMHKELQNLVNKETQKPLNNGGKKGYAGSLESYDLGNMQTLQDTIEDKGHYRNMAGREPKEYLEQKTKGKVPVSEYRKTQVKEITKNVPKIQLPLFLQDKA